MPLDIDTRFNPVAIETRRAPDGKVTFSAALASETPVDRGDFIEVLTIAPGAIDLSRFPLPLLMDHDPLRQVGVVESPVIGGDRVLRATIRFGSSDEAKQIEDDVANGIRRNLSIGYFIQEYSDE